MNEPCFTTPAPEPGPEPTAARDLQAEILALRLILTPIVSVILDAPSVVQHYEHLLIRAKEERKAVKIGRSSLDPTTFAALISAEKWLQEMSEDYLEQKLKPPGRPVGSILS